MSMKAFGDLIFAVPVDPARMVVKAEGGKFGIKSSKDSKYTLLWKVASVGDGVKFQHDGHVIHVPVPVSVGDIVLLKQSDEFYRNIWVEHETNLDGVRGVYLKADQILSKSESS
jgi:hypothetical protein